jgi:hypothetical protein
MIYSEHCKSFMRLNRIEFSLNALGKKEGPDTLAGRGRSLRLLAVWGTFTTGLWMSDAHRPDIGSILRDVTASTKRLSSHTAKPPAM